MGISIWQLAIVLAIVVLLFGAGRISKVMGEVGKGFSSFKRGLKEGTEDGATPPNQIDEEQKRHDSAAQG